MGRKGGEETRYRVCREEDELVGEYSSPYYGCELWKLASFMSRIEVRLKSGGRQEA